MAGHQIVVMEEQKQESDENLIQRLNTLKIVTEKSSLPLHHYDTLMDQNQLKKIENNSRKELLLLENEEQIESQISLNNFDQKQQFVNLHTPDKSKPP